MKQRRNASPSPSNGLRVGLTFEHDGAAARIQIRNLHQPLPGPTAATLELRSGRGTSTGPRPLRTAGWQQREPQWATRVAPCSLLTSTSAVEWLVGLAGLGLRLPSRKADHGLR